MPMCRIDQHSPRNAATGYASVTEAEYAVIQRLRELHHGSVLVKVQDGVLVFMQKIEDFKLA